jgi:hypothetical protein
MEVSWQITAVRADPSMQKRMFKVEEEKAHGERGYYLDPQAYDQPEERGVQWARGPQLMHRLKERRIQAEQRTKQIVP